MASAKKTAKSTERKPRTPRAKTAKTETTTKAKAKTKTAKAKTDEKAVTAPATKPQPQSQPQASKPARIIDVSDRKALLAEVNLTFGQGDNKMSAAYCLDKVKGTEYDGDVKCAVTGRLMKPSAVYGFGQIIGVRSDNGKPARRPFPSAWASWQLIEDKDEKGNLQRRADGHVRAKPAMILCFEEAGKVEQAMEAKRRLDVAKGIQALFDLCATHNEVEEAIVIRAAEKATMFLLDCPWHWRLFRPLSHFLVGDMQRDEKAKSTVNRHTEQFRTTVKLGEALATKGVSFTGGRKLRVAR